MKETHTDAAAEFHKKLEQLLELDDSLDSALQSAADIDQAMALILQSAQRHSIALDAATLKGHMRSNNDAQESELMDEQLTDIAGGRSFSRQADTPEGIPWRYQSFRVI